MDIPENNHKKIASAVAVIVIIVLILFAITWKTKTKKETQITKISPSDNTTIPAPPEMPKISIPNEVTSISGTVEKIEGKTLTVKAFFYGEEKTFTVTVGDATKIQKSEMKKEIPTPEEGKTVEPFTITDAKFSDIRQNDNLSIEASENIKEKTSFVAESIAINIMMKPPDVSVPPSVSSPSDATALPKMENIPAPPSLPDLPDIPTPPTLPTPPKN
jgi:hypothetical protein